MFSSFPAPGGKVPLWAIFLLSILGDLPDLGAAPTERRQPEHGARDPADNQFGQGIALSSRYLAAGSKEEIERPETLFGNVKVFDARTALIPASDSLLYCDVSCRISIAFRNAISLRASGS